MSLDSQYLILNSQMKLIGVTDINGATPFSNDTITRQIADTDNTTDDVSTGIQNFNTNNDPNANSKNWNHTGEITVAEGYPDSYKVAANNYLMYWDNNAQHYYLMYISQEIDAGTDASGRHVNTYELENVLITNMNDYIPDKTTLTDANAETAFTTLFTNSNWVLDFQATSALSSTTEFDGTSNAMGYLQAMLVAYDVEMDAYVELYSNGDIKDLVVKIVDKMGTDANHWVVDYGKNLTGITRTTIYSNVITKLHILGRLGETIAKINNGKDYLVNDEANRLYNPNWKNGTYLEGTTTFADVDNISALKSLGQKQLDMFSHPRISYEVTPTADFKPSLGDSIRGTDWKMTPELAIDARVISVTTSMADYTQNLVQFGEFVTLHPVTPSYIQSLFDKMNNQMTSLLDEVRNGTKVATVHLVTPTGANWTTAEDSKTVIAKIFVDSTNITSYFSDAAFIWIKTDPVSGVHDSDWEEKHENDGSQLVLDDGDVGTVTCKIDGAYLKDDPEIINQENYKQVWSYNFKNNFRDPWGEGIYKAPQYVHIDEDNGFLIFSSGYDNDAKNTKQRGATSDTKYHRFKLDGTYMDSMVLQGGGHGSSFGYQAINGNPQLWTTIQTEKDGDFLGCVNYQPNTVVKLGDKSVVNMCPLKNFKRISVDFEHGWVLAIAASDGSVEITSMDNVTSGNWTPSYKFNTSDYDFKQWTGDYKEGVHELQSNDIYFPYVFLNAGHFNNKDRRLSICVNVVTESLVFRHTDTPTMLPDSLIVNPANDSSMPFEPETIGYYHNGGKPYLLQGFDYHRINDSGSETSDSLATLWKTDLIIRDDSGDVTANDDTANDDTDDGADNVDEGGET
ncbi:hypothetical protein N6G94_10195 (plasmid) [Pediococcus inopinatus]|uniref:phage tail spike protein n=1 Tax=Pediococcus inopinatus TaxID=114090 RepID=UPI002B26292F|nr:phage tail spike protein [Pediococcus inopinatus]WPC18527.1 hypothetical protein N6G94_10195 [Pediococcus inopinatus]